MFMALHPEVQARCQKELDEVLGSKPPTIVDMNRLNYIMATLMEIQRCAVVARGSLPHYLLQDTQVGTYKFKKGTLFIANLGKFLNDPNEFPEPSQFKPERFLDEERKIRKSEYLVPFGIGKRICMGESLAKNELFIFFVRFLQRLKIGVVEGKRPDPSQYFAGVTNIPKPYTVSICARE